MSTRPLRILVVDDDPAMVGAITALVGTEGHQVITAYDGLTAVKRFREERPDLVLLDLAMPGPDGFTVAGQIRAAGQAPILVVSGESGEAAKVRALGIGADDYLTKPFGKAELLARISAIMRRVDRTGVSGGSSGPLEAGSLQLEPGRHEARVGDVTLTLTPTEFRLLEALVRAAGDIVPHHQLARAGWPAETDPDVLWLKPHLARLRSKVEAAKESSGRPLRSCAASAQLTLQPRASRPPIGLKWNPTSPATTRRHPQDSQVTGAARPSRTARICWSSRSEGCSMGGLAVGSLIVAMGESASWR